MTNEFLLQSARVIPDRLLRARFAFRPRRPSDARSGAGGWTQSRERRERSWWSAVARRDPRRQSVSRGPGSPSPSSIVPGSPGRSAVATASRRAACGGSMPSGSTRAASRRSSPIDTLMASSSLRSHRARPARLRRGGTFAAVARRTDLDAALLDLARAAGAKVIEGDGVTGIAEDLDGRRRSRSRADRATRRRRARRRRRSLDRATSRPRFGRRGTASSGDRRPARRSGRVVRLPAVCELGERGGGERAVGPLRPLARPGVRMVVPAR